MMAYYNPPAYPNMAPPPQAPPDPYLIVRKQRDPVFLQCRSCGRQSHTSVDFEMGTIAWILFFVLLVCSFGVLCFIPCCIESCKDAVHSCSACQKVIGKCRAFRKDMGGKGKKNKGNKMKY